MAKKATYIQAKVSGGSTVESFEIVDKGARGDVSSLATRVAALENAETIDSTARSGVNTNAQAITTAQGDIRELKGSITSINNMNGVDDTETDGYAFYINKFCLKVGNKVLGSDGNVVTLTNYRYCVYNVQWLRGETIILKTITRVGENYNAVAFYSDPTTRDSTTYISGVAAVEEEPTRATDATFTITVQVPNDAVVVCWSIKVANADDFDIKIKKDATTALGHRFIEDRIGKVTPDNCSFFNTPVWKNCIKVVKGLNTSVLSGSFNVIPGNTQVTFIDLQALSDIGCQSIAWNNATWEYPKGTVSALIFEDGYSSPSKIGTGLRSIKSYLNNSKKYIAVQTDIDVPLNINFYGVGISRMRYLKNEVTAGLIGETMNLFDKYNCNVGSYDGNNNIAINPTYDESNIKISNVIPVTAGTRYYCNYSMGNINWVWSDANFNGITRGYVVVNSKRVVSAVAPENAAYLVLVDYNNTGKLRDVLDTLVITEKPIKAGEYKGVPHNSLNTEDIHGRFEHAETLLANQRNHLEGVTINGLGDSMSTNFGYLQTMFDELGMEIGGSYKGGTKVAGSATDAFWQDARVNALSDDAQIIVVYGGTNDARNGFTAGDALHTNYDTDTFIGAYNVLLSKLYYKYMHKAGYYPNVDYTGVNQTQYEISDLVVILVAPPFGGATATNATYANLKLVHDAIIEVGKLWSLPVIDLFYELGHNAMKDGGSNVHAAMGKNRIIAGMLRNRLMEVEPYMPEVYYHDTVINVTENNSTSYVTEYNRQTIYNNDSVELCIQTSTSPTVTVEDADGSISVTDLGLYGTEQYHYYSFTVKKKDITITISETTE